MDPLDPVLWVGESKVPSKASLEARRLWRGEGKGGEQHVQTKVIAIWMFPKIVGFPLRSSILIGVFHYFHHPFVGYPYFWNHPLYLLVKR